jgi:hypothetical protein
MSGRSRFLVSASLGRVFPLPLQVSDLRREARALPYELTDLLLKIGNYRCRAASSPRNRSRARGPVPGAIVHWSEELLQEYKDRFPRT